MIHADDLLKELQETWFGGGLSNQIKSSVIHYLDHILKILNYHRSSQYMTGGFLGTNVTMAFPQSATEKAALQYLQDKGVITSARIPRSFSGEQVLSFRADFEKAVGYYKLLSGHDPDIHGAYGHDDLDDF